MKEVFIGIGIELGYLIGLPCVTVMGGWRIVFGVAVFFVLIMKTGMVSPAWCQERKHYPRDLPLAQTMKTACGTQPSDVLPSTSPVSK